VKRHVTSQSGVMKDFSLAALLAHVQMMAMHRCNMGRDNLFLRQNQSIKINLKLLATLDGDYAHRDMVKKQNLK
jgi:hypothetical protein